MNSGIAGEYKRFNFNADLYRNHNAKGMLICFCIRFIVTVNRGVIQ